MPRVAKDLGPGISQIDGDISVLNRIRVASEIKKKPSQSQV